MVKSLALSAVLLTAVAIHAEDQPKSSVPRATGTSEVSQILSQAYQAAAAITVRHGYHVYPDPLFKTSALRAIAAAQVKIGDTTEAFQTAAAAEDSISKASVLLEIGKMQAKTGYKANAAMTFQKALQTAATIERDSTKAIVCRNIAIAQAEYGEVRAALQTIVTLRGTNKAWPLQKIASAQAKAGDVPGALQTSTMIKMLSYKSTALLNIASTQAKTGDKAGARLTFQKALKTTANIEDNDIKASALRDVALAQIDAGDRVGAAMTLQQALKTAATIPPPRYTRHNFKKNRALVAIARTQAKAGDVQGALQTANSLPGESKDHALVAIAQAQAKAGDVQGALQTANSLPGESKDHALVAIAQAQAKAGDVHVALQTAVSVKNVLSKAESLTAIAVAQADAGDRVGAAMTLQQALKTAVSMPSTRLRFRVLILDIAAAQVKARDLPGALQTAGYMSSLNKAHALRDIAAAQAEAGDVHGALARAEKQETNDFKAMALLGVAEGILRALDRAELTY